MQVGNEKLIVETRSFGATRRGRAGGDAIEPLIDDAQDGASECEYQEAQDQSAGNDSGKNAQHELRKAGFGVARQIEIPIQYAGLTFEEGLRLDLLIDNKVLVEIKAVEIINPVWHAQVLSHLKLTGLRLGYLINFDVPLIREGIKRFIL